MRLLVITDSEQDAKQIAENSTFYILNSKFTSRQNGRTPLAGLPETNSIVAELP